MVTTWKEPQREKSYLLTCAPNEDSNQPAHPRSLISLRCPDEETLHPLLSKIRPVKISRSLIRIFAGRTCPEVRFLTLQFKMSTIFYCSNISCLTWCFQESVISPCYQNASDMAHLGDGDALKAAYNGFCDDAYNISELIVAFNGHSVFHAYICCFAPHKIALVPGF